MKRILMLSVLALSTAAGGVAVASGQDVQAAKAERPYVQKAFWGPGQGHRDGRHFEGRGPRGEMGHHGGRHGGKMLEIFDADKDGAVTQAEIDAFRNDQIARFDADKDGQLSLDEYQALWLERMREHMVDAFQSHDADGDGEVTAEEFNTHFAGLVERLDRNGDGELNPDDRRGGRHGKAPGPQRDGGPEQEPDAAPTP